ncbi:hypothetical protein WG899_04855 [Paucibacter sp. AS339]|uniref:substrate-binding periplasmic protein n=1 Tax=Paucibacter hankyongi TaxID=3133434 RepID=UPI0030A677C9
MAQDSATAPPVSRHWRVCLADVPIPPYISLDAKRPGIAERLLQDTAKQLGLSLDFDVFPSKRCRLRLQLGQSDAIPVAPTAGNLNDMQFPMRNGAVDFNRRVASAQLVWVKRKDSALAWDGQNLQGAEAGAVLVGTRASFRAAIETARALGLKVDDTAFDVSQLFRKLAAHRVDVVAVLREEAEAHADELARHGLQVLPVPVSNSDFYLGIRTGQSPERQAQAEAWWDAIAKLRDKPEYRPR